MTGRELVPASRRIVRSVQLSALEPAVKSTSTNQLLRFYLLRHGWSPDDPGPGGALWRRQDNSVVAVPDQVSAGTVEWRSVVERLAAYESQTVSVVAESIRLQLTDVTRLSAANDIVIAGSIPLAAGVSLVSSAWAMLRAAATSSVRPRPHIAGNFSKIGDGIAASVRMGHTQEGSYVLPLLMPLTQPVVETNQSPVPGLELERVPSETAERRVTRTLAQALTAIDNVIVQPARDPRNADLAPIVVAGASREFVSALHRVLSDPSVARFEAAFDWAGAVGDPAGVPAIISVPAEAAPLLEATARLLKKSTYTPDEVISGPIVEVRLVPGDPLGQISVQTIRRGRPAEVRVTLTSDALAPTFNWARDGRTVVVEGRVRRVPGQPLIIDRPLRVQPVDETYLPESLDP